MAGNTVYKKYIVAKGEGVNRLKVECYYDLGGMNYWNYKNEPRGYYVSVTPVEVADRDGWRSESYVMFSGVKKLVKEVARKSAKAAEQAKILAEQAEQELVDYVCAKGDIVVE